MRVADYVFKQLAENHGIEHVFMITGGGCMHLIDAASRQPKITCVFNHHEQACAIAAEGYARTRNELAVVLVTSGPGGTNTLTGLIGEWLDSVPVLYLSGQVKQETTILDCPELGLRQLGDQEINIVDIVAPVTKYAAVVDESEKIDTELHKALTIAGTGRPGPVWLDIPLDIQGAPLPERLLPRDGSVVPGPPELSVTDIDRVAELLRKSRRPVVVGGHGIRISGAVEPFRRMAEAFSVPVLTTFNGFDTFPSNHPLFGGRIGTVGTRAGNFALQNADLVISIGSRNNIRQVSYNWKSFAREAAVVSVDIDSAELAKKTLRPDVAICADARRFIEKLSSRVGELPDWSHWREWCRARVEKYPAVLPDYTGDASQVHPYVFMRSLTALLPADAVMTAANGTACIALFQAGEVKKSQRIFWNSGCASMGYALPASIGAAFARPGKRVVCVSGDGSIMMNLQELATISHNRLPVTIFVLNNGGYQSIRMTQNAYFAGNLVGCGNETGVGFPDFGKLAEAFGLAFRKIGLQENLEGELRSILDQPGPAICEVVLSSDYEFSPKLSSRKLADGSMVSSPLEDMYPFLPREELLENSEFIEEKAR